MTGDIGCLLIGEGEILTALKQRLEENGIPTQTASSEADLYGTAQRKLCVVRRSGGVCVAAAGELWTAALALASQLDVDRVVLIDPVEGVSEGSNREHRQWIRGFAMRNLFFCVADVLVLDSAPASKWLEKICRRLCNAEVWRSEYPQNRVEEALSFLKYGGKLPKEQNELHKALAN